MQRFCLVAMKHLCQDGQYITDAELDSWATMDRETIGFINDHEVVVLVENPSAQFLSKHIGVNSLQLLCESH